jgi:hypothetical protein
MSNLPSIDLHPDKISGAGPESALRACKAFLDKALASGHRQVRIITGVGLRGDGTPRLRMRVEQEVLSVYQRHIEQTGYEQGGAVIKVWLKGGEQKPTGAWHRHQRKHHERSDVADREERLMVAHERLRAADLAYDEGDLRRCRLKLNQVAREFGWELADGVLNDETALALLDGHWERLEKLDQ